MMKSILRFLLAVLVLILPCLTFAEEPKPIADTIAVEPYYSLRATDVEPNDRYYVIGSQWNLAKIEAPAAWEITTGSDEVVIAVISTGVDLDHAELRNKIWTNPGEIPGNGIDDDGNGYVDDVHGWDFVNKRGEPQDDHGHGTFVATVAAAETNNGLGITGLSRGTETMPIVVDGTSVLFETSLGSLDSATATVTKNTADGVVVATLPAQVPGMAMIPAMSDSEVATTAVTTQAVIASLPWPIAPSVGDRNVPPSPYPLPARERGLATSPAPPLLAGEVGWGWGEGGGEGKFLSSRSPDPEQSEGEGEAKQSPGREKEIASSPKPVLSPALSEVEGEAEGTLLAMTQAEQLTTTVEFEPGLPYTVTLVAYPTSLSVSDTSTLTATVKDQDNNDVTDGTVVTFETSLGSLDSSMITKTIVSGIATAELTSQVAGTAVVTATSDSKYDTANVTFNPGLPYTVTVEAYPTSIPVRGFTSTITAIVKDQYDNPATDGTVVTFTTDLGTFGSSSVVTTTINGVATATLKSGAIDGTANVSATVDSVVGQTQVIFLWDGGIAGVSWGAQIMPIKVIKLLPDGTTTGSIDDLNAGIKYAADNGARILLLDFQVWPPVYVESMENAIDSAYGKGALLVAGAGNCGGEKACKGLTNPVMYPGAFPHVLAVAATSQTDDHLGFSEYHPYVDVAAPGESIPGFILNDYLLPGATDYRRWLGTDYAAAHVAGLAALIWSVDPTFTNDEVEGIIESTAVDQVGDPKEDTPCKDDYFGYGRIDANAAVRAALHYLHVEPSILEFRVYDCINPPLQTLTSASPCTWSVTATTPWLSISSSEGYTTTVSINTDSLPDYGVHCATITATSTLTNCVNYSQTIPVTVVYTQCWRSCLPLLLKNHGSD